MIRSDIVTCKECSRFSNYMGGTCLYDMFETKPNDSTDDCAAAQRKEKEREYMPNIEEEYSEYDRVWGEWK